MGDFLGTKVIAERWGASQNTITKWCREKRIPGAKAEVGAAERVLNVREQKFDKCIVSH